MRSETRDNLSESKDLFILKTKKFIVNIFKYVFFKKSQDSQPALFDKSFVLQKYFISFIFFHSIIPKIG